MITEKYINSGPNYKTFVIPLKTIIKDLNFIPKINDLVINLNNITKSAYQFIKCYILFCYKNGIQYEINEEFIRYSIKILGEYNKIQSCDNQFLFEQIKWFYNNEFQPLYGHVKYNLDKLSHYIADISVEINTAIQNNIQEHFIQHFLRFINKTTESITTDKSILYKFKNELLNLNFDNNPIFIQWKNIHLLHIINFKIEKSINYNVKVNPLKYLNGMLYMNSILESLGCKLFQVIPQRTSLVPKQIPMFNTSMVSYFPEVHIGRTQAKGFSESGKHESWSNLLNFNHKVFKSKNYEFSYKIHTDGISCSLIFIRKDLRNEKINSKKLKWDEPENYVKLEQFTDDQLINIRTNYNIVGCDPGKRNLVYMVDDKGNKLQYTSQQRRFESKSSRCKQILEREKLSCGISIIESGLCENNGKSANYDNFKSYVQKKNYIDQRLSLFYQNLTHRRMRLRRFIYGKKSVDQFISKIGKKFGSNCIISYGDYSESTQMKNFVPTMGKGLRKLIHRKYHTFTTCEAYTSRKCSSCYKNVVNYKFKCQESTKIKFDSNNKLIYPKRKCKYKEGDSVRGLLVCSECVSSNNKKIIFRNRDANGAINIKNLAKIYMWSKIRPKEFCYDFNRKTSQ